MDETREIHREMNTLWLYYRIILGAVIITFLLTQIRFYRMSSHYQEVIQQNQEMIAELEFQNAVLQQVISILEEVNGDGPQRTYLEEKHGFDGESCMYDRKILQIIAGK